MNDGLPSCDAHDGYVRGCVLCLRAWLDRPPPPSGSWRDFERPTDERDGYEFELERARTDVRT
jgi:hypothetical protein